MDLVDRYRTFHPAIVECTFFSSVHGTFLFNIFSDQNGIMLKIDNTRHFRRHANKLIQNNILLNEQ